MGLTVTDQALSQYDLYQFSNSDAYSENAVDSSEISAKYYGVSNLTNAVEALSSTDSSNFSGISNVTEYSQEAIQKSQLSDYETINEALSGSNVNSLLSNDTDLTGLYHLLNLNSNLQQYIDSLEATCSGATDSYLDSGSGSSSGSILDVLG